MPSSPPAPERVLQRLDWHVVRRLDGLLQGEYRSLFRGPGVDLAGLREYQPGDDVRYIDWNVTARTTEPYVREYHEDREITAWFLLDLSPSVDFGTVGDDRLKRTVLVDFVTTLARVLTRRGNRIGAIVYGGEGRRTIPVASGRTAVLRLVDELLQRADAAPTRRRRTSPSCSRPALRTIRRRSLVVIVSDFISDARLGAPPPPPQPAPRAARRAARRPARARAARRRHRPRPGRRDRASSWRSTRATGGSASGSRPRRRRARPRSTAALRSVGRGGRDALDRRRPRARDRPDGRPSASAGGRSPHDLPVAGRCWCCSCSCRWGSRVARRIDAAARAGRVTALSGTLGRDRTRGRRTARLDRLAGVLVVAALRRAHRRARAARRRPSPSRGSRAR